MTIFICILYYSYKAAFGTDSGLNWILDFDRVDSELSFS